MAHVLSIGLGFFLTTVVGGWWASRLQQRSWDRQNQLRLEEEDRKRASDVCRELSALLDRRLYRMRRLYWAIDSFGAGHVEDSVLEARRKDYDEVVYQWNDALNTNLALVGSHFGEAARRRLDRLYEDFRRVGGGLERGLRTVRSGADLSQFPLLDSEFEGWTEGGLNSAVYLFVLTMMSQLREGLVGRGAPNTTPVPGLESITA